MQANILSILLLVLFVFDWQVKVENLFTDQKLLLNICMGF